MTDPIQQAVDGYLLMQRKAAAWDMLYFAVANAVGQGHTGPGVPPAEMLAQLDKLLVEAQP